MPRYIAILVAILLVSLIWIAWDMIDFTPTIWNGTTDISWYNEEKSEFTIVTAEQLAGLAELLNAGNNFEGKTIKLERNIMLNDTTNWKNWKNEHPANKWNSSPFNGTFDGNGFVISGIFIYIEEKERIPISNFFWITERAPITGLFSFARGEIKNLGITASYIENRGWYNNDTYNAWGGTGLLAGVNNGTISNSYAYGWIAAGADAVGGLVGKNAGGIIDNSHFVGTVKGTYMVGGLVGDNHLGGTIINSYSSGTVEAAWRVGGLVGNIGEVDHGFGGEDYRVSIINNCYTTSSVKGNSNAGGFAGSSHGGVISNSYSIGKVTGGGAFVGEWRRGGSITNSYYNSDINEQGKSGAGTHKTTAEMKSKEFADKLNFDASISKMNAWVYSEGNYPILSDDIIEIYIGTFFASGDGTEANPYIINTKKQLEDFSMIANIGVNFTKKHIKLGQDIDLGGTEEDQWISIGKVGSLFNGTFDGNGFMVSKVYIKSRDYNQGFYNQGFFAAIDSAATIKNLRVVDSYIEGTSNTGGLVGYSANGTISNSHYAGDVIGRDRVGGLVGNNTGTVSGSYSSGTVKGDYAIGGLVGENTIDMLGRVVTNTGTISSSYSSSTVTGCMYVGALVGHNYGTISDSHSTGKVTGKPSTCKW